MDEKKGRGRPHKTFNELDEKIVEEYVLKCVDIPYLAKKYSSTIPRINSLITRKQAKVREKYGLLNTVSCTKERNNHCIYGTVESYKYCRYCIVEGKSRGCNAKFCDKYVEGTPLDKYDRKDYKRKYVENVYTDIPKFKKESCDD